MIYYHKKEGGKSTDGAALIDRRNIFSVRSLAITEGALTYPAAISTAVYWLYVKKKP